MQVFTSLIRAWCISFLVTERVHTDQLGLIWVLVHPSKKLLRLVYKSLRVRAITARTLHRLRAAVTVVLVPTWHLASPCRLTQTLRQSVRTDTEYVGENKDLLSTPSYTSFDFSTNCFLQWHPKPFLLHILPEFLWNQLCCIHHTFLN